MPALVLSPPKLRKWQRLSFTPVASYRILEVCRVELQDGSGRARGDAFTIRCPDWCNVVAITPDDRIVLVWQYRFGTDVLSLEIPGGVVDENETPAQAAGRELTEETGYEAGSLVPLLEVEPNPALQNNRCFTFLASDVRPTQATSFDPQEELETVLVPASRLGDLLDGGQIRHSLVQGALEAYWRKHRC
jgi:ADP-ribose pyrophosphatase YjhB (NUDIX family)